MPRIVHVCVLILVGGCVFKANYDGGEYACSDSKCPEGLFCDLGTNRCGPMVDAPPDTTDVMIDAPEAALTCADPGIFAPTGGTRSGTTAGRMNRMSSACGGFTNVGLDAVFQITLPAGKTLGVSITGARKAYVLSSCVEQPSTPMCLNNVRASAGNPRSYTPTAGTYFVVVDDETAGVGGTFGLTLTVTP